MKVFHGIENYSHSTKSILTIGTFDGIHIGHQKIIRSLVSHAREKNLQANLLTFFPHPRMILQKETSIRLIDTQKEKERILESLGIDNLIVHPFSKDFSRLTATEFTRDILIGQLGISSLYIGYDHRFGKNREATVEDLIEFGRMYDFEVITIPAQDVSSITVSSTKIRDAIKNSEFEKAKKFLGRPYELNGTVIKGDGLGRTIGFPTANLKVDEHYKLIPNKGVYLVRVRYNENDYLGMMNIGNRPTIEGDKPVSYTHLTLPTILLV